VKICLTNKYKTWHDAETGKGKFAMRLINAWRKMGIEVTTDPGDKVDIDLHVTKKNYDVRNAKIKVVRVGPVTYDSNMPTYNLNADIRHYMKSCDGIVYQSDFSRKAINSLVWNNKKTPYRIIHNGADPDYYKNLKPYETMYKVNFLASTREWVWEKRLDQIVDAFMDADIPESCLWIAGRVWKDEMRFPKSQRFLEYNTHMTNIRFLGDCDDAALGRLYRMATAMIHAVYIDACPNAVAEAMCAGCPVIMNGCGGQFEMSNMERYKKYQSWNYRVRNRRKQPAIDKDWLVQAMRDIAQKRPTVDYNAVDINTIAERYIEFFEELLCQ
jgi:glycosyltransferase involved in cell wall biosynthesis